MKIVLFFIFLFFSYAFANKLSHPFINLGHSEAIQTTAISPNGKYLLSAGKDAFIKLWDIKTGKELKTYIGFKGIIRSIIFTLDNKHFISGSSSGELKLWDIKTGKIERVYQGHHASIRSIDISNDGKQIITGSGDNKISLWNLHKNTPIRVFSGHTDAINSVKFSRDNKYLISGSVDKTIKLWTTATGNLEKTFKGHSKLIYSIAIDKHDKYIVSTGADNKLILWDIQQKTLKWTYNIPINTSLEGLITPQIYTATFISNGKLLLGGSRGYLKIFNLYTNKIEKSFGSFSCNIYAINISSDGRSIFSANKDGIIKQWDIKTQNKIKRFYGNKSAIFSMDLSDDDSYLVSGNTNGIVYLWNLKEGKQLRTYKSKLIKNKTTVASVSVLIGPKNKYIYSSGTEGYISRWSLKGDKNYSRKINHGMTRSIALSRDGKSIITAGDNKWIHQFTLKGLKFQGDFNSYLKQTNSVDFSPDAKYIIAGGSNGKIIYSKIVDRVENKVVFNANEKATTKVLLGHKGTVSSVKISSNGKLALSGDTDGQILLWNLKSGKKEKVFQEHLARISSLMFSPNGKFALSSSLDTTVKLWDLNHEKSIKTFYEHKSMVTSAQFTKDMKYIVSSSSNGKIIIRDIKTGKELLSMISFNNKDWLSITPEGYFNGNKNAAQYLNITRTTKDGLEPFDFSQLYDHFFRPDLVKLKLAGEEEAYQKAINGMTYEEALKNPPPKLSFKTIDKKKAKMSGYSYDDIKTTKRNLALNFNIKQINNGGVGLIRIYQEGKLIKTIGDGVVNKQAANAFNQYAQNNLDARQSKIQQSREDVKKGILNSIPKEHLISSVSPSRINNKDGDYNIDLELISGANEICIEAFNKTNTVTSYRECLTINSSTKKREPKLYVIAAGVNEFESNYVNNLNYSVKDAQAISKILKKTQGKVYKKVIIKEVLDENMTRENLLNAVKEVQRDAGLEDTILFYISTHGVADDTGLYFIPHNNRSIENDISFKELFQELQSIKSLNQIYIADTCQSGKASDIVSSVYDSRASVFARSSGVHMLLATTKGTSAFENKKLEHGEFTYKILQALKSKKSDKNEDGLISIIELSKILKKPANNEEYQYPIIRNIGNDVSIQKIR